MIKVDLDKAVDSYRRQEFLHGYVVMCPHCFSLFANYDSQVDEENEEWYIFTEDGKICAECGKSLIPSDKDCADGYEGWPMLIDEAIAYPIAKLNKMGFKTKFCCSGHFGKSNSYVSFEDRHLIIKETIEEIRKLKKYLEICDMEDNIRFGIYLNREEAKKKYKDPFYPPILFRELLDTLIIKLKEKTGRDDGIAIWNNGVW